MTVSTLPEDFFDGLLGGPPKDVELVTAINTGINAVDQSLAELHVYADVDLGDDENNDGLSMEAPKKTLNAVKNLIPKEVRHWVVVHLRGTFVNPGDVFFTNHLAGSELEVGIVVDGGDQRTVVAGPFTSDSASTVAIGDSGQAWTPDQYKGFFVEILDGPAAGQTRTIYANDATSLEPHKDWSTSPVAGAPFQITKPATTINATSGNNRFYNICSGEGRFILQRLSITGTSGMIVGSNNATNGWIQLSQVVHEASADFVHTNSTAGFISLDILRDPDDPGGFLLTERVGISILNAALSGDNSRELNLRAAVVKELEATNFPIDAVTAGSRLEKIVATNSVGAPSLGGKILENAAGYRVTKVDGSAGVGILLDNAGNYDIGAGVEISDHGSHGIELRGGQIKFLGVTVGSGNTGAGVYAHSNSVCLITDGATPTLTGTVGDLSTDGTTEESTWAVIDAGTPVAVTAEMTMAKEV